MGQPFVFKKVLYLVEVTGRRARSLDELLQALAVVPAESVGYHMHREFLAYKFAPIEYPNDFAYFVARVLGDDILGEKLGNLRVFRHRSLGVDPRLAGRGGARRAGRQRRSLHVRPRAGAAHAAQGAGRRANLMAIPWTPPFGPGLDSYRAVVGDRTIDELHRLAEGLCGKRVQHVNATREGGGVAEILNRMVPLMRELGLDASWDVLRGEEEFFRVTKAFHNAIQGDPIELRGQDYE